VLVLAIGIGGRGVLCVQHGGFASVAVGGTILQFGRARDRSVSDIPYPAARSIAKTHPVAVLAQTESGLSLEGVDRPDGAFFVTITSLTELGGRLAWTALFARRWPRRLVVLG
jgi:hypothetical protein